MIKSKLYPIIFILNLAIFFLYGVIGEGGIVTYFLGLLSVSFIFKKYLPDYRAVALFTYSIIAIVGLFMIWVSVTTYGKTFGPYYDDSLYYLNVRWLSDFVMPQIPPTLFEVVLSIPMFLGKKLFSYELKHIELLPINWLVASINVILSVYVGQFFFKLGKLSFLPALVVLFNFNFLDTSVHLYRDTFVMLFMLLAVLFTLQSRYKVALLFSLFVFLIRGANGALMVFFIAGIYCIDKYHLRFKTIVLGVTFISLVVVLFSNSISSSFFRSVGGSVGEEMSMAERIRVRQEGAEETAAGGTANFRDGNIVQKMIAPLIYTFSPFYVPTLYKDTRVIHSHDQSPHGKSQGYYNIFQVEFFLIIIHLVFTIFFTPRILCSFYYGLAKEKDVKTKFIILFIIASIILISFVSMQARHRTAFIIFFPFLLAMYDKHASSLVRSSCSAISIFLYLVVLFINFIK